MDHTHQEDGTIFALPTPTDTPYRTPPRSRSRQSRRHGSNSPDISSSPVPLPCSDEMTRQRSQDAINSAIDENISPLDPRRFTPSLHASLVSEILSLRREVESKTKDIEHLEISLDTARNRNESLHETLASTSKEARSLKRQMQLLEGGTVSALSELSKERDEALSDVADLRKRLELSQKKIRSQEESVERTQTLWDRDRGNWETEKRALETKVHIVEGRLKVVLGEISNSQMTNGPVVYQDVNHHESPKRIHLRKGSTASIRSMGIAARRRDSEVSSATQDGETHGYRLSTMTLANGHSTSLADELAFDEEEEDQIDHNAGHDEQISADELPEERPMSAHSRPVDLKARKVLGITSEDQLPILAENGHLKQSVDPVGRDDVVSKMKALCEVEYVDAAVQYSPPASPKLSFSASSSKGTEDDDKTIEFADALSHQDHELVSKTAAATEAPSTPFKTISTMISTSSQTSCQLPSPPWTPLTPQNPIIERASASPPPTAQTVSAATQTDIIDEAENSSTAKGEAMPIPIIAIHPPASRPTTPTTHVMLPPQTKNASCQVNVQETAGYTSSSMQTEEIRVDARIAQLPQKLLPPRKQSLPTDPVMFRKPSVVQPSNPLPNSSRRRLQQPGTIKPATSRRRVWESNAGVAVPSPTPEVDEPITSPQTESLIRTSQSSASNAADENHAKDSMEEPQRKRFDEDDIFSRPTAKFTLRAGKLVSKTEPETDYQDVFDKIDAEASEPDSKPTESKSTEVLNMLSRHSVRGNAPPARPLERKPRILRSTSSTKQLDIRKAALISSGTAAHQSSRDRSPSAPVKPPPFPVPTRHSSRQPPLSVSEGHQSPTPTGRSPRKRDGRGRKPLLRKVRSATNVSRPSAPGHYQSPSPPVPHLQYDTAHDPGLPLPLAPLDDTIPAPGVDFATSFKQKRLTRPEPRSRSNSASTVLQQTSVVDAIAQTMVGEWMYKYVRRRKSFGVPEPKNQDWDLMRNGDDLSASITNTGVRHKRWVWLAPYERAVMWSSKQPTSGSALMGKSGRKLEIQSVLDVRDDNQLPKSAGAGPAFNRSILILTPERALKFTATSQERHYVWLTALSFLSHSPLGFGDLTALPNIPQQEYLAPQTFGGSLRRNPIRDSIRVAKGRDPRGGRAGHRSFTTDGVIPPYHPDREALYQPYEPIYATISDAADPPTVPRYHPHSRHRSNTGPRLPPTSFRNFSNHNHTNAPAVQPPSSTYSVTTASDIYSPSLYSGYHPTSNGFTSTKSSFSRRRGSEASASIANSHTTNSAAANGYFDQHNTAPTMRMEAFIGDEGGPRPRGSYRTRKGRKKDMGYWGVGDTVVSPTTMMMPAVELPDEFVEMRSNSRSPTVNGNGNGRGHPGMEGGVQIDAVSIMSQENFDGKRHVIEEDLAFESAHGNHFRGF